MKYEYLPALSPCGRIGFSPLSIASAATLTAGKKLYQYQ